jgi:hypothetical protein
MSVCRFHDRPDTGPFAVIGVLDDFVLDFIEDTYGRIRFQIFSDCRYRRRRRLDSSFSDSCRQLVFENRCEFMSKTYKFSIHGSCPKNP